MPYAMQEKLCRDTDLRTNLHSDICLKYSGKFWILFEKYGEIPLISSKSVVSRSKGSIIDPEETIL